MAVNFARLPEIGGRQSTPMFSRNAVLMSADGLCRNNPENFDHLMAVLEKFCRQADESAAYQEFWDDIRAFKGLSRAYLTGHHGRVVGGCGRESRRWCR
jgi:hypothetical protein